MKPDRGTPELIAKRDYLRSIDRAADEFQVERFHRQGILSIDHARAGIRLYVWHMVANQQGVRACDTTREVFGSHEEIAALDRFGAADKYFKTMTQIRHAQQFDGTPYGDIIRAVCIDEMGLEELAKHIKKRRDTARKWLIDSFDTLVEAQLEVFRLEQQQQKNKQGS